MKRVYAFEQESYTAETECALRKSETREIIDNLTDDVAEPEKSAEVFAEQERLLEEPTKHVDTVDVDVDIEDTDVAVEVKREEKVEEPVQPEELKQEEPK